VKILIYNEKLNVWNFRFSFNNYHFNYSNFFVFKLKAGEEKCVFFNIERIAIWHLLLEALWITKWSVSSDTEHNEIFLCFERTKFSNISYERIFSQNWIHNRENWSLVSFHHIFLVGIIEWISRVEKFKFWNEYSSHMLLLSL
jgi:hypothetical protein